MALRSILISTIPVLLLLLALEPTANVVKAAPGNETPTFLYTAASHYDPLAWMHGADRFSSGATISVHDALGNHPLVPNFSASADSAVSFDGQRVLFAGKLKAGDPWQIWEVPLAGGEPRRVSSSSDDNIRPLYLPEDRVVYARRSGGRYVLETVDLAGGKPLPLTYGAANVLPTDVLRDGRILFESAYPLGAETLSEIFTVYSDGSGVESYRCDHGSVRHSAKQIMSGDVVFALGHSLARFTSARAQEMNISAPAGDYAGEVVETVKGDLLMPWRTNANARFQLMLWTPGSTTLRLAMKERDADTIQPTLVAERAIPNRHPSGLHDWPNANLLCLNAYTSKFAFAAGSIHSVRIYTREGEGPPRLLGTAPVERDGSFFVQVPSEQPLQIELLDSAGKTLQRESGFFWMRRGEQRGCVGCHAGPEASPENAVPMVLLKSTTPADMTGSPALHASGGH